MAYDEKQIIMKNCKLAQEEGMWIGSDHVKIK